MATSTNKAVVLLDEGQKNKVAAINNVISVWDAEPVFAGILTANPTEGSPYPVGSAYFNSADNGWYRLVSRAPDVWDGFGMKYFGDSASAPASGEFDLGSTYYDTTLGSLRVLRSKSPDVWG